MKISPHFDSHEFACHDGCGFDDISMDLIAILEDVHNHFGAAVSVNSGCRCLHHNRAVGGVDHSQHMQGHAADITVKGHHPAEVATYLEHKYKDKHGIGRYSHFTHVDCRRPKARWHG